MAVPGGLIWLVTYDLKRTLRLVGSAALGKTGGPLWRAALGLIAFSAIVISMGLIAARALAHASAVPSPILITTLTYAIIGFFLYALAGNVLALIDLAEQPGDFELLITSPLPAQRVVSARLLNLVILSTLVAWAFVAPFLLVPGIIVSPRWLGLFPMIAAVLLLATALALPMFILLVRWGAGRLGRRTLRGIVTAIGLLPILAAQIPLLLETQMGQAIAAAMAHLGFGFAPGQPQFFDLPARAVLGDAWAILASLALASAVFALSTHRYAQAFLASYARYAGARSHVARTQSRPDKSKPFRNSVNAAFLMKEARNALRDPRWINLAIVEMLTFALAGLTLSSRMAPEHGLIVILVPLAVLAGGAFFEKIAVMVFHGEAQPELLLVAPLGNDQVLRQKQRSTFVLSASFCLPIIAALTAIDVLAALVVAIALFAIGLSATLVAHWSWRPRRRSSTDTTPHGLRFTAMFGLMAIRLAWCGAALFLILGNGHGLTLAAAALAIVFGLRLILGPGRTEISSS